MHRNAVPPPSLQPLTCPRRNCKWIASAFSRLQLQCPAKSPRARARHRLLLSHSRVPGTSGESSHTRHFHLSSARAIALAATRQQRMNINKSFRGIMPAFLSILLLKTFESQLNQQGGRLRWGGCARDHLYNRGNSLANLPSNAQSNAASLLTPCIG
jgi:hypothetical protein